MFKRKNKPQEKTDFTQLFFTHYQLGKEYLAKKDYERANYHLNNAYGLSLSFDDLDVDEKYIDECNDQLMMLENENLIYASLLKEIEAKSQEMTYEQITIWNLLTFCRLEKILKLFENKKGCEILQRIPQIIENIIAILTQEVNNAQIDECIDFLNDLYDFGDSPAYHDPLITVSLNHHTLQITDFIGGDFITSLDLFLDHEVNNYISVDPSDNFITDFIAVAFGTLQSYYLRTTTSSITEIPQIKNEIERIWQDYKLLMNEPDGETILNLVDTYRQMNIYE